MERLGLMLAAGGWWRRRAWRKEEANREVCMRWNCVGQGESMAQKTTTGNVEGKVVERGERRKEEKTTLGLVMRRKARTVGSDLC